MKMPKMIIFDYGNTLLCEPGFDTMRGQIALHKYIVRNKYGMTAEQINEYADGLYASIEPAREMGYELHQWQIYRLLYESLGITLSVSGEQAEEIFWNGASMGAVMPGADEMLEYLKTRGIRSAVLSNICFSGQALKNRIHRLLPGNDFEFVIASSEYVFRKPNQYLFRLALEKADLEPGDVWFCGDNVSADIRGAEAAGMFPVWYDERTAENQWRDRTGSLPKGDHLHIHHWYELIKVLEQL